MTLHPSSLFMIYISDGKRHFYIDSDYVCLIFEMNNPITLILFLAIDLPATVAQPNNNEENITPKNNFFLAG
jgi:hypothetical protein